MLTRPWPACQRARIVCPSVCLSVCLSVSVCCWVTDWSMLQTLMSVEKTPTCVNQDSVRTPTAPTTVSVNKATPSNLALQSAQVIKHDMAQCVFCVCNRC